MLTWAGRLALPWLLLGLGTAVPGQAQQACSDDEKLKASSPSSRFSDEGDGTTTDAVTQLMWMRCALGQAWSNQACTGQPSLHNWQGGQTTARHVNQTGTHFYNDWRVPSLRELATVAERRCMNPRINSAVFPNTPATSFWTVTASLQDAGQAYLLDFAVGGVVQADLNARYPVRLVRSAP